MLKKIIRYFSDFGQLRWLLKNNTIEIIKQFQINQIRNLHKNIDKKTLIPFGHRVYSQNDEDGIIQEIFARIGTTNKTFVEFGVGNGLENNTLSLMFQNWKGLWIEADGLNSNKIRNGFKKTISRKQLRFTEAFITAENIDQLIKDSIPYTEIDLLSIDIDGNDIFVFEAIQSISARVVVIEYNAKFPPPTNFSINYNPRHAWDGSSYVGSSLEFIDNRMNLSGYKLVGCNITGVNAFYIREDLLSNEKFLSPFTPEKHFEACKHYIGSEFSDGREPTYNVLENRYLRDNDVFSWD